MRMRSKGCLKRFDRPGGAYASSLGCSSPQANETPGPRCIPSRAPEGRTRPLLPRLLLMTLHPVRPPLPTSPKQLRRLNRGGKNNRDTYRGFRFAPPPATLVCPFRATMNQNRRSVNCSLISGEVYSVFLLITNAFDMPNIEQRGRDSQLLKQQQLESSTCLFFPSSQRPISGTFHLPHSISGKGGFRTLEDKIDEKSSISWRFLLSSLAHPC